MTKHAAALSLGTLLAILAGAGCARGLSLKAPDFNAHNARVVFMPAMVALYSLDENADLQFDDVRSAGARLKVNTWLRYLAPTINCRVADLREVAATALPADAFYDRMNDLTRRILADDGLHPLSAWKVADTFEDWIPVMKADYVVFIVFRGAYETEARKQANFAASLAMAAVHGGGAVGYLLGLGPVIATRAAALVVVDLGNKRVVRVKTIDFAELVNYEIPDDLGKLMEALELGRPIKVAQP